MTITKTDHGYDVLSDSGHTYRVIEQSSVYGYEYDGEYMAVWGCNCPAGRFGKSCKHVAAVIASLDG